MLQNKYEKKYPNINKRSTVMRPLTMGIRYEMKPLDISSLCERQCTYTSIRILPKKKKVSQHA
jgi:hypothetical protein